MTIKKKKKRKSIDLMENGKECAATVLNKMQEKTESLGF